MKLGAGPGPAVRWGMKPHWMVALVLVIALLVTAVTPARAEAMEVGTVLALVGAAIVVVILVTYLIVANARGERRAAAPPADDAPLVFAALDAPQSERPPAESLVPAAAARTEGP